MKAVLAPLSAVLIALTPASALEIPGDKVEHFSAGIFAAEAAKTQVDKWIVGCGTAIVLGIAKEAYDSTGRGHVDPQDAIATAAGGCLTFRIRF